MSALERNSDLKEPGIVRLVRNVSRFLYPISSEPYDEVLEDNQRRDLLNKFVDNRDGSRLGDLIGYHCSDCYGPDVRLWMTDVLKEHGTELENKKFILLADESKLFAWAVGISDEEGNIDRDEPVILQWLGLSRIGEQLLGGATTLSIVLSASKYTSPFAVYSTDDKSRIMDSSPGIVDSLSRMMNRTTRLIAPSESNIRILIETRLIHPNYHRETRRNVILNSLIPALNAIKEKQAEEYCEGYFNEPPFVKPMTNEEIAESYLDKYSV